jgi:hypothetical protein
MRTFMDVHRASTLLSKYTATDGHYDVEGNGKMQFIAVLKHEGKYQRMLRSCIAANGETIYCFLDSLEDFTRGEIEGAKQVLRKGGIDGELFIDLRRLGCTRPPRDAQ